MRSRRCARVPKATAAAISRRSGSGRTRAHARPWPRASARASWRASLSGAARSVRHRFARPHAQVERRPACAAAQDLQHAVAMDTGCVERLMQPVDRVDGDAVEADDEVAFAQARACGRAAGLDRRNAHRAALLEGEAEHDATIEVRGGATDAEVAAPHATML